jgi:hypothetical protein
MQTFPIEKETYYNVGDKNNIVISQSSLKEIDPDNGGHPQSFLTFFDENKEEKKSKAIDNGSNIHLYCEDAGGFEVANVNKPTEAAGLLSDEILKLADRHLKETPDISPGDILTLFEEGREIIPYYNNRSVDSAFESFKKAGALDYITFAFFNRNKIVLTKDQKVMMEAIKSSLNKHPTAKYYLFGNSLGWERLREHAIMWESEVPQQSTDGYLLKKKMKLDTLIIDHENKKVIFVEIKSYSKGSAFNYAYHDGTKQTPFSCTFETNKVHNQLAFYTNGFLATPEGRAVNNLYYTFEYKVIAIETTGRYNVYVFNIPQQWIHLGKRNVASLEARVAFHMSSNKWDYQMEEYLNDFELNAIHIPYAINN